jgi:hypothetical protein
LFFSFSWKRSISKVDYLVVAGGGAAGGGSGGGGGAGGFRESHSSSSFRLLHSKSFSNSNGLPMSPGAYPITVGGGGAVGDGGQELWIQFFHNNI